ncbi:MULTISPECIES: ATP-binding cassette domain-containing protein [Metallosphaera]|uniref:ATP-binding cassette domain-containing protein n=1 Tax=Metallosphaera TaxID=41980 RepID=UPI001F05FE93|nr:ATP-binding cassette domain-containing protein [Metallosphaera sedula]MCH1770007.1 ATP-binding cassette domain-containing protein [Metallosphaera sedula]MCP6728159.1 ATP-binding cassette domain-containing protein [Metallosphaera sedula]
MIDVMVTKRLGNFTLNAQLNDQGTICVTGPNGSGKSTLLNIIAGFIKPDKGYVKLYGKDVTQLPPEKRGIVLVTQDSFIPSMKVDDHLRFGLKLSTSPVTDAELEKIKSQFSINFTGKVRQLSLGQRERVSIVTAILRRPHLLLLDEAMANISDKEIFLKNLIDIRKSFGFDLIFTTQDVSDSNYADHHYVMSNGSLLKRF